MRLPFGTRAGEPEKEIKSWPRSSDDYGRPDPVWPGGRSRRGLPGGPLQRPDHRYFWDFCRRPRRCFSTLLLESALEGTRDSPSHAAPAAARRSYTLLVNGTQCFIDASQLRGRKKQTLMAPSGAENTHRPGASWRSVKTHRKPMGTRWRAAAAGVTGPPEHNK